MHRGKSMKTAFTPNYLILLITIFLFSGCNKIGCGKDPASSATDQKQAGSPSEEPIIEEQKITSFDSINFDGLNDTQIATLTTLFNDEICPCGYPKTFAQCLVMKQGCEAGVILAQWATDQLKNGAPERFVLQAVSEEINIGFLGEQKNIDVAGANHKGNKNAPTTIVEFADFECPSCKFASKQIKEFIRGKENEVQIYFMHFPLNTHPNAERAAIAAEAAGLQGKFWQMHDLLFDHDGALTDSTIKDLAMKIFNVRQMAKFDNDLTDPQLKAKILAQKKYAVETLNLMATPTFLFNGRPYHLSFSKEGFETRLRMEKNRTPLGGQAIN